MTYQPLESPQPTTTWRRSATVLTLAFGMVLALAACSGTTTSPAGTGAASSPTTAATAAGSGAAACIDAQTAAIIQSLTAPGADIEAIITEDGDALVAGLQSFTPPPDATEWRDNLVAAIEDGDTAEVEAQLGMIGSEVTLEFC